jgi:hypothetical protein
MRADRLLRYLGFRIGIVRWHAFLTIFDPVGFVV